MQHLILEGIFRVIKKTFDGHFQYLQHILVYVFQPQANSFPLFAVIMLS